MKTNNGNVSLPHWILALAVAWTCSSSPLLAQPAPGGHWSLTGTPTGGYTVGSSGTGLVTTPGTSSLSFTDFGIFSYNPLAGSFSYTGTVQWVPANGDLQTDPAPDTVTLSETSYVYGTVLYSSPSASTDARDGLGDPPVVTHTTGYPGNSQSSESKGTRTTTVRVQAGGSFQFTRYFSNHASGGINEGLVTYSVSVG